MNPNLVLEYYPKITDEIRQKGINTIKDNKAHWDEPFFTDTQSYIDFEKIKKTREKFTLKGFENLIVLGTGGSIQTLLALQHLSEVSIYPIMNSRSVELAQCLEETSPENSLVIPISRSGKTLDINSTIGTFIEEGYPFLGLSSRGPMNDLLKSLKSPILGVPDLSGRFAASITNVAIVPGYIAGIDVHGFLESMSDAYKTYMNFQKNPALEYAIFLHTLYKQNYRLLFSMPYSHNLEGSTGLLVQEISESTGKEGKGLMGAYQEAPLCQHSVLEYLLGGTKGIVTPLILTIENEEPDLMLPSSLDYIHGNSAQNIVNYQADATFQALIKQSVPSASISVKSPEVSSIADLIAFIQSTVYYLCLLLDVNWANNPKVNIGKEICNKALQNNLSQKQRQINRKKIAEKKFADFY
ncbi:MAG: hypothetical protein R6U96_06405 [Promethearchaeia archaeon]